MAWLATWTKTGFAVVQGYLCLHFYALPLLAPVALACSGTPKERDRGDLLIYGPAPCGLPHPL